MSATAASTTPAATERAFLARAASNKHDFFREEGGTWVFVLRTLLTYCLTGWLAMRLELEQPSTAMMTTVIVMHRQSGMVLAKSFYRALGTFAGAGAALLIVGLFPQQRELFLPAMALWLGACAGGATLYRNFKSYAFVLAGYTAAIIALPVASHPTAVFDSAMARIAEVLLGLLVSGVMSDVVFPSRMRDTLRATARSQFWGFVGFVRDSTAGAIARETMEKAHLRFVREATTLEDLRSSVIFEDPDTRARSGRLRLFNQHFMATSTSFQSLHHLMNRLIRNGGGDVADALIVLYRPLAEALAVPETSEADSRALLPKLSACVDALPARGEALRAHFDGSARADDFDTGAELVRRFARELHAYVEVAATLRNPRPSSDAVERVRFTRGNDLAGAALAMLRTTLVMGVLSTFWILTAWPSGASALLLASILCALFATTPAPAAVSLKLLWGFALGTVAAYAGTFWLLPHVDGFALLAACIAPLFLIGAYMTTRPQLAVLGLGYLMCLTTTMGLTNLMHYDPAGFVNNAIAQLASVGATVLAFQLLPSAIGSAWMRRRQLASLRAQVALAAEAPLPGLRHRFESVNRDLLQQVVTGTVPGSEASRTLLAWALAVHETGRALIELRHDAAAITLPKALARAVGDALDAVARLYEAPDAARYLTARDRVLDAIAATHHALSDAPETRRLLHHLHLIRISLVDADSVLAEYMPSALPVPSALPAKEARHAV
ncbi:FUSC family protein [Luteimonas panaciterrae]|uniref:FUSC family protein n=1 Tax=Luteimonas panaciterrae TaxID=363885 RepID=UPI001CF95288|nr:FUSC family protein [Luteimonas panaciterrae]